MIRFTCGDKEVSSDTKFQNIMTRVVVRKKGFGFLIETDHIFHLFVAVVGTFFCNVISNSAENQLNKGTRCTRLKADSLLLLD